MNIKYSESCCSDSAWNANEDPQRPKQGPFGQGCESWRELCSSQEAKFPSSTGPHEGSRPTAQLPDFSEAPPTAHAPEGLQSGQDAAEKTWYLKLTFTSSIRISVCRKVCPWLSLQGFSKSSQPITKVLWSPCHQLENEFAWPTFLDPGSWLPWLGHVPPPPNYGAEGRIPHR